MTTGTPSPTGAVTPTTTPSDAGTPTTSDPILDALDAALAGEHAVVYAYGVIGAHLDGDDRDRAARELTRHRSFRDVLTAHMRQAGGAPPASEPAYSLPFPVTDAASAAELADLIEERLAGLYADVVTATEGRPRADAAAALVHGAQARATWSGTVTTFPGLDDRLTLDE